jgi:hypothetical protein
MVSPLTGDLAQWIYEEFEVISGHSEFITGFPEYKIGPCSFTAVNVAGLPTCRPVCFYRIRKERLVIKGSQMIKIRVYFTPVNCFEPLVLAVDVEVPAFFSATANYGSSRVELSMAGLFQY